MSEEKNDRMQIVIDIPEEMMSYINKNECNTISEAVYGCLAMLAIKTGTPLPKGHGDLIDVNRKITVPVYDEQYEEWGEKILTVREALNRWSDEGITVKDVVIPADKVESEDKDGND